MGTMDEAEIDRLPVDLLAHIFFLFSSFTDLAQASSVCRKWREGVKQSLARKERLSFAGWKMDDVSTARLVHYAYNLKELDINQYASLKYLTSGPHSAWVASVEAYRSFSLLFRPGKQKPPIYIAAFNGRWHPFKVPLVSP